jgi:ferrochelatase
MRVVDRNPLWWQPLLQLVILNRRPQRSARLYQRIWTEAGSPLLLHSQKQVEGLQARLGSRYRVVLGMRYGSPSIESAMQTLEAEGIDRILVFPMFPQFSCSTTGSIYDAVIAAANGRTSPLRHDRKRTMPTLRFVPPYYADAEYINALATTVEEATALQNRKPDRYLFTFHGIPKRYVDEGDPYRRHCEITADKLADALGLSDDQWQVSFQSQFGKEPWLEPYTEDTLRELGSQHLGSLMAACLGFTADCLETLDEIGHEGAHEFTENGGGAFTLVPCLNAHPAWLDAMTTITRRETLGWLDETDENTVDTLYNRAAVGK